MIDEEKLKTDLSDGVEEYIMAASIHIDDGKDYQHKPYNIDKGYVVSGWRHTNIWETINIMTGKKQNEFQIRGERIWKAGFLTNKNRFLSRSEALKFVLENKQLLKYKISSTKDFCNRYCGKDVKNCIRYSIFEPNYNSDKCIKATNNKDLTIDGMLTTEDLW